ncbi:MAG TPA: FUSC family protein, partial [Gemmatimonadaceae bacterium]|nr:FUSC family protein [Gemmatimonadaceae bacterium]
MSAPRLHPRASPVALTLRVAPVRPAYAAGLRAAVATVVPLLVATALGSPHASWAMLAGFSVSLSDKGGAYATRARAFAALTLIDGVAAALGAVAAGHPAAALLLVFAWTLGASLLRALGAAATSIGISSTIVLLISLAAPAASPAEPLVRFAFVAAGGAWATFLALALWPLRPYRPTRLAVAACYDALASYARALHDPAEPHAAGDRLAAARGDIRARIEQARELVGANRRGRPGETPRGERLLVLVEIADQLFGLLVALTDAVESQRRSVGGDTLAIVAARARRIAREVTTETRLGRSVDRAKEVLADGDGMTPSADAVLAQTTPAIDLSGDETSGGEGAAAQLQVLLERLTHYAALAEETSLAIARGGPVPATAPAAAPPAGRARVLDTLRAALAPDSLVLRHATRVALVTAVAVCVVGAVGLSRGYWVTLTAVIILQPTAGPTMLKALQRVAGTVLGGIITAGLAGVLRDERAIVALTFVLAAACVAVLPLNYTLYSMLLTPTFVLLAEVSAGDWHLAGVRVVNTLIGGGLALAGAWLLWPNREHDLFARSTAGALRAARDHLMTVAELWAVRDVAAEQRLAGARRRAGQAALNGEASLERLLAEWPTPAERLEAAFARIVYLRRLTVATTALAAARLTPGAEHDAAAVRAFVDAAARDLEALAARADAAASAR